MVPSDGWVDPSFLRLRPVSRVDIVSFCKRATPLFTAVFQHDLLFAVASQVLKSMPHLVKLLLHVPLNLSFGLLWICFPMPVLQTGAVLEWWYIWSQQTEVFPGYRIVALTAVRATI